MATISLDFDAPDLPTAVELVSLTRTDTDASVTLPVPPDFTESPVGTWSITFTEPADGLTYAYAATATWDDASTSTFTGTVDTIISDGYEGRYTTAGEVETFLGTMNITVQSDTDGDGVRNTASIQQGIISAEARVDLHTGGPYEFAATTAGTVAAQVFAQWSYKLAAYEYAAKRGFEGNSENEFKRVQDEVIAEMAMFKADPMAGVTGSDPDTSTFDAFAALTPARGKLNCPDTTCTPCGCDTGCN